MIIHSMTATFGKLENQTLTLEPGLNVIQAPNEWGKSTWCAFLTIMLYGLDTRAKTTKTALAEKERFAPWSGAPMSGRMEITWQGRRITLERRAKGRTPMGDFSAFETESGLPVTELTATNCGQTLLGVERSVFQRAGFIQLSDLPVTQDESLRRRLNALVTTGDETGAGDALAQKLKDLKNKCRFNRTGLLPQAEAQRDAVEDKLRELDSLKAQIHAIDARQAELERTNGLLENHLVALDYAESLAGQQKLAEAQIQLKEAQSTCQRLAAACDQLPQAEQAEALRTQAGVLLEKQTQLHTREILLPPLPQQPPQTARSPEETRQDLAQLQALEKSKKKNGGIFAVYIALAALLLCSLLLPAVRPYGLYIGLGILLSGIAVMVLCLVRTGKIRNRIEALYDQHPGIPPRQWLPHAQAQADANEAYAAALAEANAQRESWQQQRDALQQEIDSFTQGKTLASILQQAHQALDTRDAYADAQRELTLLQAHVETLQAMAKPAPLPEAPDELTLTQSQTRQKLSEYAFELRQLHTRRGQALGKMEALGRESALLSQLDTLNARIHGLNQTYRALELALSTLSEAEARLQRRFAPRISRQAQAIFSRLTEGRYSRITLSDDLSVSTGADTETTLRPAIWRSEGTIDQLYLSLRLAVARELTPQAPLILDDAFARFDDTRLEKAMEVLAQEAQTRQVILFTCQSRERQYT